MNSPIVRASTTTTIKFPYKTTRCSTRLNRNMEETLELTMEQLERIIIIWESNIKQNNNKMYMGAITAAKSNIIIIDDFTFSD